MIWMVIIVVIAILVNEYVVPRRPGYVFNFNGKITEVDIGYHVRDITLSLLYLVLAVSYFMQ